jgi:hypothetical protein
LKSTFCTCRIGLVIFVTAFLCAPAFAQYGGMGGSATPGGSTGGVYTPPKGGYKSSTGIAIGAGVAAAIGITYFMLRSRHSVVGCVGESAKGTTLSSEKATYILETGGVNLKVGDQVKLRGKKTSSGSGQPSFAVKKLIKDYGACNAVASLKQP